MATTTYEEPTSEDIVTLSLDADIDLNQPGVLEALVEEIKARGVLAKEYIIQRDTAKTITKRDIYSKKLTENNNVAATLIVALEKIVNAREVAAAADLELIETNDGEFISPSDIESS